MNRSKNWSAIALIACVITACDSGEVRGFLVAKLDDGSTPFVRRIQLQINADTTTIHIPLTRERLGCEITLNRPPQMDVSAGNCKGIAGFGEVNCSDGRSAPLTWAMTSCRSGYGISIDGSEGSTRFSFGFANNLNSAMNQLDEVSRSSARSSAGSQ